MKRFAFAMVFTFAVAGYALAEDITCAIQKVDTDKGTITYVKKAGFGFGGKGKGKGGGKKDETPADPVTVSVAKTVKIVKGKFDMESKKLVAGDEIKDGFKDDTFTKIGEKGVFATITVADDGPDKGKVTQVMVFGGKKKDANE
jgi:hypothetical protein